MAKKQNSIFKRQNEKEMQQLIVTQHFSYSTAKRWIVVLFFILVMFPLGINIALFFHLSEKIIGLLSLFSLLLLILGEVVRDNIEKQKRVSAMLQQKFDLYVFDMNTNCILDENIISEQIEKYKNKDWHRKVNWYENYEFVNDKKVIFYCQKENIDWTGNIAKRYRNYLLIAFLLLLSTFIINAILNNQSIIKMLSIMFTAIPLLSFMISSYKKIKKDDTERLDIEKFANDINTKIESLTELELDEKIHVLQTMIYKFRQTKYLIPDWFEAKYYKHLQAVEKRKAGQRIDKAKKRQ